jgi:hypothetical protein
LLKTTYAITKDQLKELLDAEKKVVFDYLFKKINKDKFTVSFVELDTLLKETRELLFDDLKVLFMEEEKVTIVKDDLFDDNEEIKLKEDI